MNKRQRAERARAAGLALQATIEDKAAYTAQARAEWARIYALPDERSDHMRRVSFARWHPELLVETPPSGEIDEIAVESACRGERVCLNRRERRLAVLNLTRRGYSARAIGELLGISTRGVVRHRAGGPI